MVQQLLQHLLNYQIGKIKAQKQLNQTLITPEERPQRKLWMIGGLEKRND